LQWHSQKQIYQSKNKWYAKKWHNQSRFISSPCRLSLSSSSEENGQLTSTFTLNILLCSSHFPYTILLDVPFNQWNINCSNHTSTIYDTGDPKLTLFADSSSSAKVRHPAPGLHNNNPRWPLCHQMALYNSEPKRQLHRELCFLQTSLNLLLIIISCLYFDR
jgi:hypothetical protein